MNEWNELDALLSKTDYTYLNDYGVMFNRMAPGFMFVDSPWPGEFIDQVSLVFLCNDASEFFKHLGIENADQINIVKPETFLNLFYAGEVILVSTINEDETLEFQFCEGKLVANKENNDVVHVVKKDLKTPEDFIEYTKQHFANVSIETERNN